MFSMFKCRTCGRGCYGDVHRSCSHPQSGFNLDIRKDQERAGTVAESIPVGGRIKPCKENECDHVAIQRWDVVPLL